MTEMGEIVHIDFSQTRQGAKFFSRLLPVGDVRRPKSGIESAHAVCQKLDS